ncbi:hypothetical protein IWZ01DRAFT_539806 [Phyllosticta capitalensis]
MRLAELLDRTPSPTQSDRETHSGPRLPGLKSSSSAIKIDEEARIQRADGSFPNAIPGFIPPRMLFYSEKRGYFQNQMWATEWGLDIAAAIFMPYHPTIPIERNFDDDHGVGSVMLTIFATACREMWNATKLRNTTIHRILQNLLQKEFDKPKRLTPGIGAVTVLSTTPLTTAKKRKARGDYVETEAGEKHIQAEKERLIAQIKHHKAASQELKEKGHMLRAKQKESEATRKTIDIEKDAIAMTARCCDLMDKLGIQTLDQKILELLDDLGRPGLKYPL